MSHLQFDIDDTCVKCGACAVDCPVSCITEGATKFSIGIGCIGCGDCYSICPVGAVQMRKRKKSAVDAHSVLRSADESSNLLTK